MKFPRKPELVRFVVLALSLLMLFAGLAMKLHLF